MPAGGVHALQARLCVAAPGGAHPAQHARAAWRPLPLAGAPRCAALCFPAPGLRQHCMHSWLRPEPHREGCSLAGGAAHRASQKKEEGSQSRPSAPPACSPSPRAARTSGSGATPCCWVGGGPGGRAGGGVGELARAVAQACDVRLAGGGAACWGSHGASTAARPAHAHTLHTREDRGEERGGCALM